MTDEPSTPDPAPEPADPRLQRRRSVLKLRLRNLPETAIARLLGVNQATVSRDIAWIRANWGHLYGPGQGVKVEEEIGEAVGIYEDAEQLALLEFHALSTTNAPATTRARARMDCLRTIMDARTRRVELLQDLGFLKREIGSFSVSVARADELRQALRSEGLLTKVIETTAEHDERESPAESIQRWLGTGA